jgi:kynurenine formamidase
LIKAATHFARGGRTVNQITLKEMILLRVFDVHAEVIKNPDHTLMLKRVKKWEAKHEAISAGSVVALRTDWSKRWPDAFAMGNKDEKAWPIIQAGAFPR